MDKQKKNNNEYQWWWVVVLVVLVAGAALWGGRGGGAPAGNGQPAAADEGDQAGLTKPASSGPLPFSDVKGARFKIFNIAMSRRGIDPSRIIVRLGDQIQFNITAVDGTYDLLIPITQYGPHFTNLAKGAVEPAGFTAAKAGTFTMSCQDSCPAGGKITGELEIVAR